MIVCLDCRAVWPSKSTFCGKCGGSFGGCRCKKGHLNPATVKFCTTCGTDELSQEARSLNLKHVVGVVAGLTAILCCRFVLSFLCSIFGAVLWLLNAVCGMATGSSLNSICASLLTLMFVSAIPFLVVHLFLGKLPGASKVLPLYWKFWRFAFQSAWKIGKFLVHQLLTNKPSSKSLPSKKGHGDEAA